MLAARRVLTTAAAVAVLAAGTCAASAAASTIAVTTGCVIFTGNSSDQILPIAGSGFTPGNLVTLSSSTTTKPNPSPLTSVQADAAGNFFTIAGGARFDGKAVQEESFNLFAADGVNPSLAAATTFRQVRAGYSRAPTPTRPHQRITHVARGFTAGARVYAHFRHHGITRVTKSLGLAAGPCGIAKRKMQVLPTRSRVGTWKVFVDQSKRFSSKTRPQAILTFTVELKRL